MSTSQSRPENWRRGRAIRSDATVGSTVAIIENQFGLPRGSVSIHLPDGRRARSDKLIRNLQSDWAE
jgi:hypothetical protein